MTNTQLHHLITRTEREIAEFHAVLQICKSPIHRKTVSTHIVKLSHELHILRTKGVHAHV